MSICEIVAKMSGFRCQFCKGSLTKVHYPKLYNMAHLLAFNVLLLPKDLTIIFIYPFTVIVGSLYGFPGAGWCTTSVFFADCEVVGT